VNQSSRCSGGDGYCVQVRVGFLSFLFVSFVLIYFSQALIITRVARSLDRARFILFMGFVLVLFELVLVYS
jgi:hypothetical protein